MAYETKNNGENGRNNESIFTKRIRAGKRRTYFFDVRATRGNDYFITLTESKKRFDDRGYERHKMFLYKEDFNKFIQALHETVDYVKTELMPDFDFDAYNNEVEAEDAFLTVAAEPSEPLIPRNKEEKTDSEASNEKTYFNVSDSEEEPKGSSVDDWKL